MIYPFLPLGSKCCIVILELRPLAMRQLAYIFLITIGYHLSPLSIARWVRLCDEELGRYHFLIVYVRSPQAAAGPFQLNE